MTENEERLFAKYYGDFHLEANEDYWKDAFELLQGQNIAMPMAYNPQSTRLVLSWLGCYMCGDCCRYDLLPLFPHDAERIMANSEYDLEFLKQHIKRDKGKSYLICTGGCPFLKDNKCIIYDYRPDACYFYPLQAPDEAVWDGKKVEQMVIRAKCQQSFKLIRKIITRALDEGNRMLLPDLKVINKEARNGTE